jgi:acyl-CoA thioester hydrolase
VSAISIEYRAAAHFDDLLDVSVVLREVRSRRLRFDYRLERSEERGPSTLIAEASTLHTPVDSDGRAVRLPEPWRAAIAPLIAIAATP